jgi:hypothetical protein
VRRVGQWKLCTAQWAFNLLSRNPGAADLVLPSKVIRDAPAAAALLRPVQREPPLAGLCQIAAGSYRQRIDLRLRSRSGRRCRRSARHVGVLMMLGEKRPNGAGK